MSKFKLELSVEGVVSTAEVLDVDDDLHLISHQGGVNTYVGYYNSKGYARNVAAQVGRFPGTTYAVTEMEEAAEVDETSTVSSVSVSVLAPLSASVPITPSSLALPTFGQYVHVSQEVLLEGEWSEIRFEGWVARVIGGGLAFDSGDEYSLEGDDVRAVVITSPTPRSKPAWEKFPDRWIKTGQGWEPNLEPKVEGAECYRCPLLQSPIADSSDRAAPADILFCGEAPGRDEVDQQDFMVGRSGSLLRNLVGQVLPAYTYSINNACMCYGETPETGAIEACSKRLRKEVEQVGAKVIVAVGGVALKALTGLSGITDYQGLLLTQFSPPVIPCFHPAAVLRRSDLFLDLVNALSKVKLFLEGEALIDVQPSAFDKRVADDSNCLLLLSQLLLYPRLYCDLETTGYSPYLDKIICVSLAGGDDSGVKFGVTFSWRLFEKGGEGYEQLKAMLEEQKVGYFNGFFDCQFLRSVGIEAKVADDPMLKQYTLDERPTAQALKYLGRRYCNAPDWEEPLRPYLPSSSTPFTAVPPHILFLYATLDACYTGTISPLLDRLMNDDNKSVYERILLPAENMLLDVCRVGIKVDTRRLEELRPEFVAKLEQLQAELVALAGEDFNPSSTKQLRAIMQKLFNYDGSTARQLMEEKFSGEEFVDKFLEFRGTRKLLGTYIDGLLDDIVDGRIHPNLRLNGTVTGRLSAGDPNMLGMPKEKGGIKKLFVADKGWLLLEADGGQMEIRVAGALAGDKQMVADFKAHKDFHGEARNRVFGRGTDKKNYTHQEVLDAKTGVFGPLYGRSAPSMARLLKCSVRDAQAYLDKLWEPYPATMQYMKDRVEEVHEKGELRSYYGRYRRWGLITDDNVEGVENEARNFPVSSTSTDTNLLVMLALYNHYSHDLLLPLLPVHDSVLCRVRPEVDVREVRLFCEKKARELLNTDMPFSYEVSVGGSWGELELVD